MKEIDFSEARRFIALLGKPAGTIRLRAFLHKEHQDKASDKGRKGGARKPLIKQWQEEGRGVYVVINDGGDTNAEITACRAFFAEWNPRHILAINYKKYISKMMKVVREKLIECSILVKELFENTEDALTETKEGKIVSVDIVNTKFIRNNIKIADATTNTSGSEATRPREKIA